MAETPAQIGRYQVKKTIGRGGMGTLLLAWDPDLERDTAIKILREDDDELRERFAFEARSAAKLRHPNIVTIFDVGTYDGQPFIAMEYIHGETLAEIIARQASLSTVKRLRLIEELCEGLGFAHERGVIHRDVKPANLMVASDGVLKVLDFGIARLAGSTGRTQAGMLVGTPNYMSPEQIVGRELDHRSDLFAVGALLYEILTYRQAFPGNLQTGILHRILSMEPEPLLEHAVGVDPALADIVARALRKEPENRYADLNAMRRELVTVRERLEAGAGKKGARRTPDSDRWARRRADEIDAHLARAQSAFDAGHYESASQSCEQALMLDSDDVRVNELFERVRRVIDEQQGEQWLVAAERHLMQGELTAAQAQLKRVTDLTPTLPRLAQVRQAVERAVEKAAKEREEARLRAESVARAFERAESGLRKGDLAAAWAAADTVLTLQPTDTGALGLRSRVEEAIKRAVAIALVEARRRLADGDERGAEDILQQLQPASSARDEALVRLREEIAHARGRLAACLASAERLADAGDFDAAVAMLQEFTPPHPSIANALTTLREEEARLREAREADARWLEETRRLAEMREVEDFGRASTKDAQRMADDVRDGSWHDPERDDRTVLVPPPVPEHPEQGVEVPPSTADAGHEHEGSQQPARPWSRRPAMLLGCAVLVAVAAGGVWSLWPREPEVPVTSGPGGTNPVPGDPEGELRRQKIEEAQASLAAGRLAEAIGLALDVRQSDPQSSDASALIEQVRTRAMALATTARDQATAAGAQQRSPFQQARQKHEEADALVAVDQAPQAVQAYIDAERLYISAVTAEFSPAEFLSRAGQERRAGRRAEALRLVVSGLEKDGRHSGLLNLLGQIRAEVRTTMTTARNEAVAANAASTNLFDLAESERAEAENLGAGAAVAVAQQARYEQAAGLFRRARDEALAQAKKEADARAAADTQQRQAQELLDQAAAALRKDDLAGAERLIDQSVGMRALPGAVDLRGRIAGRREVVRQVADLLTRAGTANGQERVTLLNQALQIDPGRADVQARLAEAKNDLARAQPAGGDAGRGGKGPDDAATRAQIRQTLDDFGKLYQTGRPRELKTVWPDMSSSAEDAHARRFVSYEWITWSFESVTITLGEGGASARADVVVKRSMKEARGSRRTIEDVRPFRFELSKRSDRWLVTVFE